jgi:hypothetical protein
MYYPQTKFSMPCHVDSDITYENRVDTLKLVQFSYFIPSSHTELSSRENQQSPKQYLTSKRK